MKPLWKIVNKIAFDLMPIGTMVERMVESPFLAIGDTIIVKSTYKGSGIYRSSIFDDGCYFSPELFRIVKEAD